MFKTNKPEADYQEHEAEFSSSRNVNILNDRSALILKVKHIYHSTENQNKK